ncbi:hypothetical protein L7F22_036344, partial [Adiantum nelumboides]|nr:hypothetical protein [Adiantum nelumboides]
MEEPPTMPLDSTLRKYFDGVKLEAHKYMFQTMRSRDARGHIKSRKSGNEAQENRSMELEKAAQCIVFRLFKHLVVKNLLDEIPSVYKAWCKVGDSPLCMFPSTMHGLTKWEIENCPWWIDFPLKNCLEEEMEMYELHAGKRSINSTASLDKEATKLASKKDIASKSRDSSRKEKNLNETAEILLEDDTLEDTTLAKEFVTYIHNDPSEIEFHKDTRFESIFGCCIGGYIQMGRDFEKGRKNEAYEKMHEFFIVHVLKNHRYHQGGKNVKWAAGLVLIDFPTSMVGIDVGEEVQCSILLFTHRMDYYPTLYLEDSNALFK